MFCSLSCDCTVLCDLLFNRCFRLLLKQNHARGVRFDKSVQLAKAVSRLWTWFWTPFCLILLQLPQPLHVYHYLKGLRLLLSEGFFRRLLEKWVVTETSWVVHVQTWSTTNVRWRSNSCQLTTITVDSVRWLFCFLISWASTLNWMMVNHLEHILMWILALADGLCRIEILASLLNIKESLCTLADIRLQHSRPLLSFIVDIAWGILISGRIKQCLGIHIQQSLQIKPVPEECMLDFQSFLSLSLLKRLYDITLFKT